MPVPSSEGGASDIRRGGTAPGDRKHVAGGGGGGSGLGDPGTTFQTGVREGDGLVTITYLP